MKEISLLQAPLQQEAGPPPDQPLLGVELPAAHAQPEGQLLLLQQEQIQQQQQAQLQHQLQAQRLLIVQRQNQLQQMQRPGVADGRS